jgi:hypothetical protein
MASIDQEIDNETSSPIAHDWEPDRGNVEEVKHQDHRAVTRSNIRDDIKESINEIEEREERHERRRPSIREYADETISSARLSDREAATVREAADAGDRDAEVEPQVRSRQDLSTAPAAWDRAAKAEWASLPAKVKAAVIKRERDTEAGVELLKGKVLDRYGEVEAAMAPYEGAAARFGKTLGQATAQLWQWFDALSKYPDQAFPALVKSYGYNIGRLMVASGIPLNQVQEIDTWLKSIPRTPQQIAAYQQKKAAEEQAIYQQRAAAEADRQRTQAMLDQWSADKPNFDAVRVTMGYLLSCDENTGRTLIPLTAAGKVDIDTAYHWAEILHGYREHPYVVSWRQSQQSQNKQQKAAEQAKAKRARIAGSSISSSAPDGEVSRKSTPTRGLSVRDSLKAAIEEISNR